MKSSHQLILVLASASVLILAPACLNYFVDPYHMYGAKSHELIKLKRNDQYQGAGLIRSYLADESLDFDTIVMGNSHAQNFSAAQIQKELGTGRVLKLSLAGSRPKRQSIVASRALEEPSLKHVVWLLDTHYGSHCDPDTMKQAVAFPTDLYQSDIGINTYIFNADVVLQSLRDLGLFPPGNAPQGDAYGTWYVDDEWWDQTVRNFHDQIRTDLEHWYHPSSLQEKEGNLPPSIRDLYTEFPVANCPSIDRLAEMARKRPDVEFYFLMAPFPVEYYLYQSKEDIAALIGMRRYAADLFDQLPNVQLHAFDHDECIVGDLGRYKDLMHYHPSVNRHMIECIANNSNILNSKSIDLHEQHWLTLLQQYQKRYMK